MESPCHYFYDFIKVIRQIGIKSRAVDLFRAAGFTAVNDLIALFTAEAYIDRLHDSAAAALAVAGDIIHMQRIKAVGAVVSVTAVCQRRHGFTAMGA